MLLHDHLDGGLRPATVIELAARPATRGCPPPTRPSSPRWFTEGAARKDLVLYLETFDHTVGVMQTKDALLRVAPECAEDLAADGVVYAEVRFAPELHLLDGLTLDEVVEAVLEGFRLGTAGTALTIGTLVTAMRHAAHSTEIAELAVRHRDAGVVGLRHRRQRGRQPADPAPRRLPARGGGELPHHDPRRRGVRAAVDLGGGAALRRRAARPRRAHRRRHRGRRRRARPPSGAWPASSATAGCRSRCAPRRTCTPACATSIAEHPIGLLARLRFRVTVNTDNRLMSGVTLTSEMAALVDAFGYGWDEIEWFTLNAMKSSFWPFDQRLRIINEQIKPGYAQLRASGI